MVFSIYIFNPQAFSWFRLRPCLLFTAVLIFFAGTLQGPPVSGAFSSAAAGVMEGKVPDDDKALKILNNLDRFFRGLQSVQVDMQLTINAEQAGQEMPPFINKHRASAKRPNLLALTLIEGDTAGDTISDGKQWYMYLSKINAYSIRPSTSTFSSMVEDTEEKPTPSPGVEILVKLMSDKPGENLVKTRSALKYRGEDMIGEGACHHLRMDEANGEVHFWIQKGEKPWLRRYIRKFSRTSDPSGGSASAAASVKLTLDFTNWSEADPGAEVFQIHPPPEAKQVADLFREMAVYQARAQQTTQMQQAGALVGTEAPAFEGDLLKGGKMKLSEHLGRSVIILDFWATWCKPCVMALPIVDKVTAGLRDKNVLFYSINVNESRDTVRKFMEQAGHSFPVIMDETGAIAAQYKVGPIPHTVIIDRSGKVANVHLGFMPDLKEQLTKEILSLAGDGPDE